MTISTSLLQAMAEGKTIGFVKEYVEQLLNDRQLLHSTMRLDQYPTGATESERERMLVDFIPYFLKDWIELFEEMLPLDQESNDEMSAAIAARKRKMGFAP